MPIPNEFTQEAIDAASEDAFLPFKEFLESQEPYKSMIANNPWLQVPAEDEELVWGQGKFYDTTVPRKHAYWKNYDLPTPTKNLNQLRHDFFDWGFCLIEDAIGDESRVLIRARLEEQAEAQFQAVGPKEVLLATDHEASGREIL